MTRKLKAEIQRAVEGEWFKPSIPIEEFLELVSSEKARLHKLREEEYRLRHDAQFFTPKKGDMVLAYWNFKSKYAYIHLVAYSESEGFIWHWHGGGSDYYDRNIFAFGHDCWTGEDYKYIAVKSSVFPNPNLGPDSFEFNMRFAEVLRFEDGRFRPGETSEQFNEFSEALQKHANHLWAPDFTVVKNPDYKLVARFSSLFDSSSTKWCLISKKQEKWKGQWQQYILDQEAQDRIKRIDEEYKQREALRLKRASEISALKLSRIRSQQIKINPSRILAATSALKEYATNQK